MDKSKRTPHVLAIAAILLCLVMVSAHFTSGMYARFTTSANGSDKGTAAEFVVSAEQSVASVEAGTDGYKITVHNKGDVRVAYTAVIVFDDQEDAARFESVAPITGTLNPGESYTTEPIRFVLLDANGTGTAPFTVSVTFEPVN